MKFDIKALAFACAILWGAVVLFMGLANLIWGGYGHFFLLMLSSWYPGYDAGRSFAEVVIATLYALVDGLIGGAVFAWLYNSFVKSAG